MQTFPDLLNQGSEFLGVGPSDPYFRQSIKWFANYPMVLILSHLQGASWQCLNTCLVITTEAQEWLLLAHAQRPAMLLNMYTARASPLQQSIILPKTVVRLRNPVNTQSNFKSAFLAGTPYL